MSDSHHTVRRVPVELRWWGLDRRSIPYAVVGFVVLALWTWVLPWVNDRVAWSDATRTGEVVQVTDQVTMTVAPGWGLVAGLRTTDETRSGQDSADQVVLAKSGVVLSAIQGPFDGSPTTLIGRAERIQGAQSEGYRVSGETRDVTTAAGLRGVASDFTVTGGSGTVTVFVVEGTGIEIQVLGPRPQVTSLASETDAMIDSLARTGGGS